MITLTVSSHPLEVGRRLIGASVAGLTMGYLAGSGLMCGGRLWIWIKDSKQKVSEVMGHIGTTTYRRQLSVGLSVGFVGLQTFMMIGNGGVIQKAPFGPLKSLGMFSGLCLTVIVGSLAAKQVTHHNYLTFVKSAISLGVAPMVYDLYKKYVAQS